MTSIARSLSCAALLLLAFHPGALKAQNAAPIAPDATGFAAKFTFHLVKLDHGILVPYKTANLNNVKFFAFYYSASWCPPCKIFTPKLVKFYNQFKPKHPDFELIFVDQDNSPVDMLAYMKADSMTWPAARSEDIDNSNANSFGGEALPDLVLLDAGGKKLSATFNGSDYLGPEKVVDDIQRLVH